MRRYYPDPTPLEIAAAEREARERQAERERKSRLKPVDSLVLEWVDGFACTPAHLDAAWWSATELTDWVRARARCAPDTPMRRFRALAASGLVRYVTRQAGNLVLYSAKRVVR